MRRKRIEVGSAAAAEAGSVGGRRLRFVGRDDLRGAVEAAYARAMEVPLGEVDVEVRRSVVTAGVESFLRHLGTDSKSGRTVESGESDASAERLPVEETSFDAAQRALDHGEGSLRVMEQETLRGALAAAFERALEVEFGGVDREVLDSVVEAGVRHFFGRLESRPVLETGADVSERLRKKVERALIADLRERHADVDETLLMTVVREGVQASLTASEAPRGRARPLSSTEFAALLSRVEAALAASQRLADEQLEQLQAGTSELVQPRAGAVAPQTPFALEPPAVPPAVGVGAGEDPVAGIEAEIHRLLAQSDELRNRAIRMALDAVRAELRGREGVEAGSPEHRIELLERRIAKLTGSLETAEKEIHRLSSLQGADPGLASVYRTVQGLAADAQDAEAKRRMLADLFDANQELRRQIAERKDPSKD
ncbi:MAG TPA: hypothetical protein VGC54_02855 [Planctomycetota bacterium]